jgi:hypothetical protein
MTNFRRVDRNSFANYKAIKYLQIIVIHIWCMPTQVTFMNLKTDLFLNTLTKEDVVKIWHPHVKFYNTENMEETKVNNITL